MNERRAPEPGSAEREAALERIRSTYRDYRSTGYGDRWSDRTGGAGHLLDERDRWLVHVSAAGPHDVVLDIGSGDGNMARTLDAAGLRPATFVGVDIDPDRVAIATSRAPWASFIEASADRIPLPDESVDLVVAVTLLSSLPEPWLVNGVTAEVDRLLRPGGRFVVYDLRIRNPRNRHVAPVSVTRLRSAFPGWSCTSRSIGLLPPLARSVLASSHAAYRAFASIPALRSHVAVVLDKPR